MELSCKRCGNEIKLLNFSEKMKLEILGMIIQDKKLFAVKKMMEEHNISHKDAKIITTHINKDFGKCHSCGFENLQEENVTCPKCKSFNYNLKIETSLK